MKRLPASRGRGPLAIASFIAIPLFFSSLMASTLAQEKPYVIQWKGCKNGICTTYHDPTSATEARIWLWALVPPLLLVAVGWVCTRIPYGWYAACAAGVVEAIAVVHRADRWTAHHIARYHNGVDLIPQNNPSSNQYDRGEWETLARSTAESLSHWTIALSLAAALVMVSLAVRRRFFARRPVVSPGGGLEGVHAPDATGASVPVE